MSSSKIKRFIKNSAICIGNVLIVTLASIVAIRGFLGMGISLYPDIVDVLATGNKGTWLIQYWMAFAIFIQLVFSWIMLSYAHRAYTRLKEFKWE